MINLTFWQVIGLLAFIDLVLICGGYLSRNKTVVTAAAYGAVGLLIIIFVFLVMLKGWFGVDLFPA